MLRFSLEWEATRDYVRNLFRQNVNNQIVRTRQWGEQVRQYRAQLSQAHQQVWAERQAAQDRQSFALREVLGGIETYKNPFDSHTVEVPAGYQHQWVNPQGQVILSNNPMYDPRHGSNVDWRSMERYRARVNRQQGRSETSFLFPRTLLSMDLFAELGHLALASRLKRLGELLQSQVSEVYAEQAVSFRARWFPVLIALARTSPLSIVQLAATLGLTHTAIAQIAHEMEGHALLGSQQDPRDRRRRLLSLTAEGEATIVRLQPLWEEVRAATAELVAESGHDLLAAIAAVEERLSVRSMDDRLRARIVKKTDLAKETLS